jgi:hypothetical protein
MSRYRVNVAPNWPRSDVALHPTVTSGDAGKIGGNPEAIRVREQFLQTRWNSLAGLKKDHPDAAWSRLGHELPNALIKRAVQDRIRAGAAGCSVTAADTS